MKNLFNLDNPVFQTLARLADLVLVTVMTLVCCVPVVTIGPALTALHKTVYDLTLERCTGTARTYFRAFRGNFKQGMISGIAALVATASLACDFLLLKLYYQDGAYTVLACLLILLTFLTLGLTAYLFPLIARYENSLREHFQNALILLVRFLPRTIAMVFLHLLPLLLLLFAPSVLLYTIPFWVFMGLGFLAQADAYLLKPVFDMLEKPKEEA
ncbi:MAG: YesL family protein [Oscillospiraceae bacterium]|nr:YesL family protein [Oscillospiraceae bacterium]